VNLTDHKQWLEVTRRLIELAEPKTLSEAEDTLIKKMIQDVEYGLAPAMRVKWDARLEQELGKVFSQGFQLFRLLHRQQANFNVQMIPAIQDGKTMWLNPEIIEHVNNADDGLDGRERRIHLSVFPLVCKTSGGDAETVTIVSRAKVIPTKIPAPVPTPKRGKQRVVFPTRAVRTK
jgi:hypothetical protein